ncbi:glycosyltransferase family 2 protein [Pandoraea soli]|uniref:Glycosyltransferase group 2 n=1 Tax=Pandoraea soli TaxID=2508293 RepID=A0ABY6W6L8_9BURK|nr:glycosyltransferase family 2 protein [Pandoraea soli]VVE32783.1 glycosyltransferase group 2 [Pandoraea soli]
MQPLLSVVIPTHNRGQYAIHAIRSLLAIDDSRLEVVVTDTSTDGRLEAALADNPSLASSPRLRYIRPTERLDMTGNHNAAIGAATGRYVCLIGDDDTIAAEALDAAQWALENDIEVLAPEVVANYAWPDFRSRHFGMGHASRLYIARKFGSVSCVESSDALRVALRGAAQGTGGLPKIYHGIVAKLVLDKIKAVSGAYFHGSSPDVSGAIGLAMSTRRFVKLAYPLTIPGASGGSNTGRSAVNQHKGKLSDEAQTKAFQTKGWSAGVPKFFSVETVWAHASLETVARIDASRVRDFNFAHLIAVCQVLHGEYAAEIRQALIEAASILGVTTAALQSEIDVDIRRVRRARVLHVAKRLLRPTAAGGRFYVGNLPTIEDAPSVLAEQMRRRGESWTRMAAAAQTTIHGNATSGN